MNWRRISFALAILVLSLSATSGLQAAEGEPARPSDEFAIKACLTVLEGIHRTEAATHEAIAAVREHRRQAEKLRDWFGYERFGPYVIALGEQERMLQAGLKGLKELKEIGAMECPSTGERQNSAPGRPQ
jgi:hypothetical protein